MAIYNLPESLGNLTELYGSRELTFSRNGAQGVRYFRGTWAQALLYAPKPGMPFPDWPELTVDRVNIQPAGQQGDGSTINAYTEAMVQVDYTLEYRKPGLGDPPRYDWEFASEVLATGEGREWSSTGKKIDSEDLSTAVNYPLMTLVVNYAVPTIPITTIFGLVGKVNDDTFQGAAAGTLLFEGASASAQYNYDERAWYFRVTYRFLKRMHSHNEIWHPAEKEWDVDTQDWARDTDGAFIYKTGMPGTSYWDTTAPLLYESGDFDTLLA